MTERMFGHGSTVRRQVIQFLRGDDIEGLPELLEIRRQAMFVSNLEQSIERRHAELHKAIRLSTHHSEAYASLGLRRDEVIELMREKPNEAIRLAVLIDEVGTMRDALHTLGLQHHPAL